MSSKTKSESPTGKQNTLAGKPATITARITQKKKKKKKKKKRSLNSRVREPLEIIEIRLKIWIPCKVLRKNIFLRKFSRRFLISFRDKTWICTKINLFLDSNSTDRHFKANNFLRGLSGRNDLDKKCQGVSSYLLLVADAV